MKIAIPYRHSLKGLELKYCLRSIEKYVDNPEVIIIGDQPTWIKNITHIPYLENRDQKWKEKNIYEKLKMVKDDFIFFNDDHFLLKPFNYEYHYSGYLIDKATQFIKEGNPFAATLLNTLKLVFNGDIDFHSHSKNYYRHQPIFMNMEIFKKIDVDWNKEYGYCIKSIYCHLAGIEGIEYPDLKIRRPMNEAAILKLIEGRDYFSTNEAAMNRDMIRVMENLYSEKSNFEL